MSGLKGFFAMQKSWDLMWFNFISYYMNSSIRLLISILHGNLINDESINLCVTNNGYHHTLRLLKRNNLHYFVLIYDTKWWIKYIWEIDYCCLDWVQGGLRPQLFIHYQQEKSDDVNLFRSRTSLQSNSCLIKFVHGL